MGKGTIYPDAKHLMAYLLFAEADCVRVPVPMPPQPMLKVLCTHGDIPHAKITPDADVVGGNWNEVELRWNEYILEGFPGGDVWSGQCADCGKLYYGVVSRISPRTKTAHQVVITPPEGDRR